MTIIWLSANLFGWHLLHSFKLDVDAIVTLSEDSSTVVYDKSPSFEKFNIPIIKVNKINDSQELLEELNPDIIIVAGWRQIISNELLSKYTFIGFHPTLLPYGRGPAPIINTILSGLSTSGVTMYYLDGNVDSGDIIGQETFEIEEDACSSDIYQNVIKSGIHLLNKYIPMVIDGTAPRIKQNEEDATYFQKIKKGFNKINLDSNIDEIYKQIRALSSPYDGAYIEKNGKKMIIHRVEISTNNCGET